MRTLLSLIGVLLGLLVGPSIPGFGQTGMATLTGQVTDAVTGKPLPFANVYLNGTTHGSATDERGRFTLTNVPLGSIEVVTSFLGYKTEQRTLRLDDAQPQTLNFSLKADEKNLAGVTVKASRKDRVWERQLRAFKRELFGPTFGSQCLLVNSHVVSFTETDNHLQATATEPLIIDNQALGYRLFYDLQYFDFYQRHVHYAGSIRFDTLKPADERQANRFRRNRLAAYQGSLRHLMASLADSTYPQQGFLVYLENPGVSMMALGAQPTLQSALNRRLLPLRVSELVQPGKLPFERRLVSGRKIIVFYTGASSGYSPYRDVNYAYSQLWLPNQQMQFTTDGWITLPRGMEVEGSLADDRLSTMLPADWKPAPRANETGNPPVLTLGKLLPDDSRMGRIRDDFSQRFRYMAPGVFAQVDKPFYATGDRLWLSAYLLDAPTNRLLLGETALQVDLLTAGGERIQHQWLRITDGRAAGDLRLSDSLASGVYRLRAYTDDDRSQLRPSFERTIAVYNLERGASSLASEPAEKPLDVQFLPEGGHWVVGLPARLGVKIIGPDGRGRVAVGRIVDSVGTDVARFESNRLGMGHITFSPKSSSRYYAEITNTGWSQRIPLPLADPTGLVLSADAVSDTNHLIVRIAATPDVADDPVYVLLQQRGRLVGQQKVQLENGVAQLALPLATLPAGLIQLTLFDGIARPRAERLVFLPERLPPVQTLMALNKPHYKPREHAVLNLNLSDDGQPVLAALSASIADADQIPADTATANVQTHLLLTGELRGLVEQPDFYLADRNAETRRALDDLLLTQGWRRVGLPESEPLGGVSLRGRVLNAGNQPVAAAQVVLASISAQANAGFVRSVGADEKGRFRLAGLAIADTMQLLVQLMNRDFKNLTEKDGRLLLDPAGIPPGDVSADTLANWLALRTQLQAARVRQESDPGLYRDKKVKTLKEVTVRARRRDERPDDIRRMSLHNEADATISFDDKATRYTNLYEMLRGNVPGVLVTQSALGSSVNGSYRVLIRGVGSLKSSTEPLFLMNGMPIQGEEGTSLLPYNPADIERIEILKNAGSTGMYGVRGGNGVIAFYTKCAGRRQNTGSGKGNTNAISVIGYPSVRREFYVPRYDPEPTEYQPSVNDRLDRRDVLYWKPLIQTDRQGRATLAFPISDVVRTLRITIQGITSDGRPVSSVKLVRVQ